MADTAPEDQNESLSVPWPAAVHFIRQLSHDLRNHINAIELQSTYIGELKEDPELKGEIKRLRDMISRMTSSLQKLSAGLGEVKPNLISYPVSDFVEDLRKKIAREFPENINEITWKVEASNGMLHIDPELLGQALIELFTNAFRHGRGEGKLAAMAQIEKDRFVFTLRESKKQFELSTKNWGREPLRKISQGHYGLGLNRVRVILEAHGGEMHALYDSNASMLVTMVILPLAREKA
jgi:K+-sensing histidine kinase KdpD